MESYYVSNNSVSNTNTIRLKGDFDYMSKERKILVFENMINYKHFNARYNCSNVLARMN